MKKIVTNSPENTVELLLARSCSCCKNMPQTLLLYYLPSVQANVQI